MTIESDAIYNENHILQFWCPVCHGSSLKIEEETLHCPLCFACFPVVRSIPILINDSKSVFAVSDYIDRGGYEGVAYGTQTDRQRGVRRLYRRMAQRLSEFAIPTSHVTAEAALAAFCRDRSVRPRVLVLGAGNTRYDEPAEVIYTDVAFSPGIGAIADGHDLPFDDGSFDFVLAVSVLEHVADPPRVVSEIWRVLAPEGRVYAATPFLQPVHMGAYDFTRFTPLGHRRLFRRFSEIDSGMALGPGVVAGWSLRMVLANLFPSRRWRAATSFVCLLLSVPLKLLDFATRRNPASLDGAGGVYFYGTRQEVALPDREIIGLYRGGFS